MCHFLHHLVLKRIWKMRMFNFNKACKIEPQCISYLQNGPILYSNPTLCFLLPIVIKCNKSTTMKTQTLFNFNASMCFINKELVQHKFSLVKKVTLVTVEVIYNQSPSLKLVTHETSVLKITIELHYKKIVFNVISSLGFSMWRDSIQDFFQRLLKELLIVMLNFGA